MADVERREAGAWAPPSGPPVKEPGRSKAGRWMAVGGALAVATVIGLMASGGDRRSDEPTTEDRRYAAFSVCQDFVRDQLASPGSAVFRNYFEDDGEVAVSGSGDGPYTVTSSVDSQNGFGALLRTNFICVVRSTSGDMWHLDDLVFDE